MTQTQSWQIEYPAEAGETGVTDTQYPVGDVRRYGADGGGTVDDITALNNAALTGEVYGNPGDTYAISEAFIPPANCKVDFRWSTIKMLPAFPNTDNAIEIAASDVEVRRFIVDGNKASLSASFTAGSTGCGVIVQTGGDRARLYDFYVHDCPTNGALVYGDGITDVEMRGYRIEDCAFTSHGVEIAGIGDDNPTDIRFIHGRSSGNTLGGFRAAGCDDLLVDDVICKSEGNKPCALYVGDAGGGLRRAKVVNSHFHTSNNSVHTIEVDGQVRTGALTGNEYECEVFFQNVTGQGAGGGRGLSVTGGARIAGDVIECDNAVIGFYPEDGATAEVSRMKMTNMSDRPAVLDGVVSLRDFIAEDWGTIGGSQAALFILAGADGSKIHAQRLGLASGETGELGVAVTGTPSDITIDIDEYNGTGTELNVTTAIMNTWKITQRGIERLPTYADEAAAVTGALRTGNLYKTSTGEVRVKL